MLCLRPDFVLAIEYEAKYVVFCAISTYKRSVVLTTYIYVGDELCGEFAHLISLMCILMAGAFHCRQTFSIY